MPAEQLEALVIGAGQAGLGVSRELLRRGIEHAVLEQGRIGDSWRTQRWDSFALNTPAWMNRLPGGAASPGPDAFASAADFALALQRYAFCQRLPVREGVAVRSVAARGADGLAIATDDGLVHARSVVIASGGLRVPRIPALAAEFPRHIHQVHAGEYRNADQLRDGAVLVVGGGQSGVQIADDLLHAGREVLLATSAVGRLPRRYRGRDVFAWLGEEGFFDEPRGHVKPGAGPQISGARGGYTLSYQLLARRGALLLGGMEGVAGSRIRFRDNLAFNLGFADEASARLRRRIDAYIARSGREAAAPDVDPADEPHDPGAIPQAPLELDLRRAGIANVVWATGFGPDTGFVRAPVLDGRGGVVQRDGATAVPGLFVVGHPWLRTRRSSTISGVAADAPYVADLVARRHHAVAPLLAA
jgi:putative flavoprotein involved in K+ transport